jgi:protein ImuB
MIACLQLLDSRGAEEMKRLRACAESFAPVAEIRSEEGLALFEVRGLGKMIGSAEEIAHAIAFKATELNFIAAIVLAPNREAAMAGAKGLARYGSLGSFQPESKRLTAPPTRWGGQDKSQERPALSAQELQTTHRTIDNFPSQKPETRRSDVQGLSSERTQKAGQGGCDSRLQQSLRFESITMVIRPGEERTKLGGLPLEVLEPDGRLRETLEIWGIHTFGDLAELPAQGVAERLGEEGLRLYRLACGMGLQPLVRLPEKPVFVESVELEHPLELLEPLSFLLSRMLREICAKLEWHGLAANEVEVQLELDPDSRRDPAELENPEELRAIPREHFRRIRLPVPSREASLFLKLLQLDLNAHPPPAAVTAITVKVEPVEPRRLQNGLFLPAGPEPQKLEITIARLAAFVGEGNIGSPELLDTHRPGAFRMNRFVVTEFWQSKEAVIHWAMRVFRPPLPATVEMHEGKPAMLRAKGLRGKVAASGGPWRSSGDWWTTNPWNREEWDVALADGTLYRIYREKDKGWFVEGNYD